MTHTTLLAKGKRNAHIKRKEMAAGHFNIPNVPSIVKKKKKFGGKFLPGRIRIKNGIHKYKGTGSLN